MNDSMTPSPNLILADVAEERARQITVWGGSEHDDQHDAGAFEGLIGARLQKAYYSRTRMDGHYRRRLVQIAALAVAAIERWDRANA